MVKMEINLNNLEINCHRRFNKNGFEELMNNFLNHEVLFLCRFYKKRTSFWEKQWKVSFKILQNWTSHVFASKDAFVVNHCAAEVSAIYWSADDTAENQFRLRTIVIISHQYSATWTSKLVRIRIFREFFGHMTICLPLLNKTTLSSVRAKKNHHFNSCFVFLG